MKNELLKRKYAYSLARIGMNVKEGKKVFIESAIENNEFARMVEEECYKLGASKVNIVYIDLKEMKEETKYLSPKEIEEIKPYEKMMYDSFLEGDTVTIRLESEYPVLLNDVDDNYAHAIFSHIDNLRNIMRKHSFEGHNWCIAICPNKEWAKVIMPSVDEEEAEEKFWEVLFKLCLIDENNDPYELWKEKLKNNALRGNKIDSLKLKELHFTSSNGTDLHVGLTPESCFGYGGEEEENKEFNMCNFPTEEICTSPDKWRVNGKVVTTKPLTLGGKVIDKFALTFKEGKIVDIECENNKELLKQTIYTDEGSCYLGEVALVAYHSPISMSGLVYYTTLIDENASCHLAIGRSLHSPMELLDEKGRNSFNNSSLHIDFMIGDKDTKVVGIDEEGNEHIILENGDFAL